MLNRVRRSTLAVKRDAAIVAQLREEIDGRRASCDFNVENHAIRRAQISRLRRRIDMTVDS